MADALEDLRNKIDTVDLKLLELLNERARCAKSIAKVKQRDSANSSINYYRPERVMQILARLIKVNSGPLSDSHIRELFNQIMSVSLSLEQELTVAFLGPRGTYTEAAVVRQFGDFVKLLPVVSIPDTFAAVADGLAHYGVVSVENSTEGMVNQTLDCFLDFNVRICGEVVLPIHHMLLTNERTDGSSIKTIAAHEQAFAQCRNWLAKNYPEAELRSVPSNGEAIRLVQQSNEIAGIAGDFAARLFALQTLARNIEDRPDNTTRFFVIGDNKVEPSGSDKTTIIVSTRNEPGALKNVLDPFAARSIGLSRIESRPSKSGIWSYVFFIDFDGHESDTKTKDVLDDVRAVSIDVKLLGSYPRELE